MGIVHYYLRKGDYNNTMSLYRSALSFGFFTIISRVSGFIRDVLIAIYLGAGSLADSFIVAYRLPNLFRSFFAEGAFNVSFVPIFSSTYQEDKEKAQSFANEAISFLFYILLFFTLIMEILMPVIIFAMTPGFFEVPDKFATTISLSRIVFPFLIMISILSLLSGILNSFDKFAAAAFTPTILNLSMILFLLVLSPLFENKAYALCYGILFAGLVQLVWLYAKVKKEGIHLRFLRPKVVFKFPSAELKEFIKRVLPGLFGAGVYQVNILVSTFLVSFLISGSVSWLYYANRIFHLPVGTIAVAIGTVLLPALSRQIRNKETIASYTSLNRAIEFSLLLSLPATVGLVCLDTLIIQTLFQHGHFTAIDTSQTAPALMVMALGLPALTLTKTFAPSFYARGDTRTPVKIAVVALIINLIFSIALMFSLKHVGIALATTISLWISCFQYWYLLSKRKYMIITKDVWIKALKILICSLAMGFALSLGLFLSAKTLTSLIFLVILGIVVFFACCFVTGAIKHQEFLSALKRKKK